MENKLCLFCQRRSCSATQKKLPDFAYTNVSDIFNKWSIKVFFLLHVYQFSRTCVCDYRRKLASRKVCIYYFHCCETCTNRNFFSLLFDIDVDKKKCPRKESKKSWIWENSGVGLGKKIYATCNEKYSDGTERRRAIYIYTKREFYKNWPSFAARNYFSYYFFFNLTPQAYNPNIGLCTWKERFTAEMSFNI